jgi:leader peptidase (prepilin peptidase)/N-methyltransferase
MSGFILSVLDQSSVASGRSPAAAVQETLALARHVEALGFNRYWCAEHHNSASHAGSAPEILLAAIGAWLGWQAILPILLMASIIGAAVGLAMKASGALREGRYVPFGPFLAGGGLAVTLLGLPLIFDWLGWH